MILNEILLNGLAYQNFSGAPALFADGTAAAPSISFASSPTDGLYLNAAGTLGWSSGGNLSLRFISAGQILGPSVNNVLQLASAGNIFLTAGGTNQSITLTPSGTGNVSFSGAGYFNALTDWVFATVGINNYKWFINGTEKMRLASTTGNLLLGGLTTDGTGVLQFPAATTSAGGIAFGTDLTGYRVAAGQFAFSHVGGSAPKLQLLENGALKSQWETASGDVYISSETAGKSLILRSGAEATALTLDSSQGATFAAKAVSTNATAGIGYATGAGGTVTQITSRTTGVTLNKICGAITLFSAAGLATYQSFTVTNSAVAATDNVIVSQKSGTDKYILTVSAVAAGSFVITYATTGGVTVEQPVFNFSVLKAVAA